MEEVKKQAIVFHKQIVLACQWVADHDALFVSKSEEVRSGPFLNQSNVQGSDGIAYASISPSVITGLLSERALKSRLY